MGSRVEIKGLAFAGPLIVVLCVSMALAGCQPQATTATLSPVASSQVRSTPSAIQDATFLQLGSSNVGNLTCDAASVAWSSSSNPDPKRFFLDTIFASRIASPAIIRAAKAIHGGELGGAVQVAGDWIVFEEFLQAGQSTSTSFWYIRAVDVVAHRSIDIASATHAPGTLELPGVSVSGSLAVWDELATPTRKVLKTYDLSTGQAKTLNLPTTIYPADPQIEGSRVIFIDNSTDPNRGSEDFLSRGGHLMLLNLADDRLVRLDSTATARQARFSGHFVAWHGTVADPDHPNSLSTVFDVRLSPIDGGQSRTIGSLGYRARISDAWVVWYNDRIPGTFVYAVKSGITRNLHIKALEDMAPTYALCGDALFYTPLESTKEHSIRIVTMPSA